MKEKRIFNYEEIEKAARETSSNTDFCRRTGIGATSVSYFRNKDSKFDKAFRRGREAREQTDEMPNVSKPQSPELKNIHRAIVNDLTSNGSSVCQEIAARIGEEPQAVNNALHFLTDGSIIVKSFDEENHCFLYNLTPDEVKETEAGNSPTYAELEKLVKNAVETFHCTLPQIKKFAGLDKSFDLSAIIEGMLAAGLIESADNGTITAYFIKGEVPGRFFLTGSDTIGYEIKEQSKPEVSEYALKKLSDLNSKPIADIPLTVKPVSQIAEHLPNFAPRGFAAEKSSRQTADEKHQTDNPAKKRKAKKFVEYTEEMFEEFGRRNFNQLEISKSLGVAYETVRRKLSINEGFKRAYQKGLASTETNDIPDSQTATVAVRVADEIIQPVIETELRFAHQLEHLSVKERSRDGIENTKKMLIQSIKTVTDENIAGPPPAQSNDSKTIAVGRGTLTLKLENFNLFDASLADLEFICDLSERLQLFEQMRARNLFSGIENGDLK